MEETITVEQADNGIIIKDSATINDAEDTFFKVVEDETKQKLHIIQVIGQAVWDSIDEVMNRNLTNKVKLTINYEPVED